MSDVNWHYAQGQQTFGPITLAAMQSLCARGAVTRTTLVWTDEMPEWAPAEAVPSLWLGVPPPAGVVNYRTPDPGQIRYAGFWIRFVAHLIDWIITAVIGTVIGAVFYAALGFVTSVGGHPLPLSKSVESATQALSLLASWLYYALMESSPKQATLGKMALGLRVTDTTGRRLSFGRATGRFFAKMLSYLILFIGFIMAGFTERKQALHDLIAGTLVLRR